MARILIPLLTAVILFATTSGGLSEHAKAVHAAVPQTFAWDGELLAGVKERVQRQDPELQPAIHALRHSADSLMKADISKWTVMAKNFTPPSGTKHDYMSVAIYYWPCNSPKFPPPYPKGCNTTTGLPWVSHDGVVNSAAVDQFDSVVLGKMEAAVMTLGLAYYFSDNETYAIQAVTVADQWFTGNATRMRPNLNFGQGHPGGPSGQQGGIIDTVRWVHLIDAFQLLKLSTSFGHQDMLETWFGTFSDWLANSTLGKGESNAKNNHGTWYDAQLSNYALYANLPEVAKRVATEAAVKRIDTQIMTDGQMPEEEKRTKSWSYCNYNLQAFLNLATSSLHSDVDLFHYVSEDGRSIRKAVEYLIPYMLGEKKWPHQQIEPFKFSSMLEVFRRSAIVFKNATFEAVIEKASNTSLTESVVNLIFPKSAVPELGGATRVPSHRHRHQRHHHPAAQPHVAQGADWVPSGYTSISDGAIVPTSFLPLDYL